jgi:hypothetical protein
VYSDVLVQSAARIDKERAVWRRPLKSSWRSHARLFLIRKYLFVTEAMVG